MRRRGLSYLEVLIAAAIATAGLFGAIAILPVSLMNMQRGITSDVVSAVGPSALEQAQAMGLNKPRLWFDPGTSLPIESTASNAQYSTRQEIGGRNWLNGVGHYESFCIDPRYCAELSTYDTTIHDPYKFPYVMQVTGPNVYDVRMRRVTVANMEYDPDPMTPPNFGPITTNQARLLFKCNDDVIFTRPDDATAPAFLPPLMGKSSTPVRRDYMGDYEWIATLTPQVVLQAGSSFQMTGNYNLSVVVFHQRNPRLDAILDTAGTSNTEDERLVDVEFLSNGINGGDVTIQTRAGRPVTDLDIQTGQWVMLSAMNFAQPGVPNPPTASYTATGPIFQWYKVVGFSEVYSGNRRDVTLEGQDWPVQPGNNTTPIPSLSSSPTPTRMTICSNIVGVFSTLTKLE